MTFSTVHLQILINENQKNETLSLNGKEFTFGRSHESSVVLNDQAYSRLHFKIYLLDDQLVASDLGSSNGTYVNDEMITSGHVALKKGDIVSTVNSAVKVIINTIDFNANDVDSTRVISVEDSLSEKIFSAANLKVKVMMKEASEEYAKIISSATLEYEKRTKANEEECKLYLRQKKNEIDLYNEKYKKESLIQIESELKKERQVKLEKLNEEIKKALQDAQQKQAEEDLKVEKELKIKKDELSGLVTNFEKLRDEKNAQIEEELKTKKSDLQKIISDFDQAIELKQKEINSLEALHESQKNIQLQLMEADIEKKKQFYTEQLEQLARQLTTSQKDLEAIIDSIKEKTIEEEAILLNFIKQKNQVILEIQNYQTESNEAKVALESLSRKNIDLDQSIGTLIKQLSETKSSLQEARTQVSESEEKLAKQKTTLQKLDQDIKEIKAEKEQLTPKLLALKSEEEKALQKLELARQEALRINDNHAKEMAGLHAVFLQKKEAIDNDLKIHKEEEEKRIQSQVLIEINQINIIKEESLRMVLDLEDSITKELLNSTSKVFANTIGITKFREISPDYEKTIRTSLQSGVLKLLKNELNPTVESKAKQFKLNRKTLKPIVISSLVTAFFLGFLPAYYRHMADQSDPIRQEIAERERMAAIVPVKKFTPQKVSSLGSNFVDSVLYTEGFTDVYGKEDFRSELMKKGSAYLYKQWQIDEEKSIEAYAMIFSLIDTLKAKGEKISPDNEKNDIAKLRLLEKETTKKLEKIFGNEVRLEAAMKFQVRYYTEYTTAKSAE